MAVDCTSPACEACSTFKIEGMDCHEEETVLQKHVGRLDGVRSVHVDLLHQRLRVTYDPHVVTGPAIISAVASAGMRAALEHEALEPTRAHGLRRLLLLLPGVLLTAGLILRFTAVGSVFTAVSSWLFLAATISGAILPAQRALIALGARRLDINVLMMLAVVGALAIGEWMEAASVVFLFALAQLLESRSMDRARDAVRSLMALSPAVAVIRRDDGEERVSVDAISPGEIMVIQPGEKIPLDGRVLAGNSHVNQAPITGESVPVEKGPGTHVFAGTINGYGALDVCVTHKRDDTTLARIVELVARAQSRRAPAQAFVERFSRIYTPAVIALAIVIAIGAPLFLAQPFTPWFYRALVLLVVACPCALVISTPVSVVSALAVAARKGVLIKGGLHLERAGTVRCVAFDKTGTLTRGVMNVVDVIPLNGASRTDLLSLAAALEARSGHVIGDAIVSHARREGITVPTAENVEALPGLGAQGQVGDRHVLIGNHRLFEERALCSPAIDACLDRLALAGRTTVLIGTDREALGIIGVTDDVRPTCRDAIDLLRQHGVERVVMLTGDNGATARTIAHAIGVDEYRAELSPEDKVREVEEFRRRYGSIAMVGDGVNDAPALAAADVGIAMGVAGSDAALETADIALMADELLKIPFALRLSRATLRNIKANIVISLGLKAAFLVMAVAGLATLWMAVLADTGASLIVIANALRLLRTE